jgi:hypothetical protein
VLTARPDFPKSMGELRDYPAKLEASWGDHFGFRQALIRLHARAHIKLGISPSDKVVVGPWGWLFFPGENPEISDIFNGKREYSDAEMEKWRRELEARRDWLAKQGIRYVFVVVPNKETVYRENLPKQTYRSVRSVVQRLRAYLATKGSTVDVVDLTDALEEDKKLHEVYFRTDTHWNDFGAYVGYREILRRVTGFFPAVSARPRNEFGESHQQFSGDLAVLLGLSDVLSDDLPQLDPKVPFRCSLTAGEADNVKVLSAWKGPSELGPRVVVFHDSFMASIEGRYHRTDPYAPQKTSFHLVEALAEQFSTSVFRWSHDFDVELIKKEHPDLVIQEVAERFLTVPPVGSAPGL